MSDPLPPLPRPVSYTSGYANFAESQVIGYATAYATAATEALRQRVAELERYERAWNEWRSLQSGDVQKMFDAAMRCAELEQRMAEWKALHEIELDEIASLRAKLAEAERALAQLRLHYEDRYD
jgi:CHASE1-domain containing sensor protein